MKPVAVILNDKELVRLLKHLNQPVDFPKFKPVTKVPAYEQACGPPDEDCQLEPQADLCDAIEPAPADD